MDIVQLVTLIAVLLGIGSFIRWWRRGFPKSKQKHPLWQYIAAVAVVWTIILSVAWAKGTPNEFTTLKQVFLGYVIGMIAMFIATRVYQS